MRRLLPVAAVLFLAVVAVPSPGEEPTTERTDPKLPDVPGPFHAFNITGRYKGRFHSRISEYGLEPMVMIFTRQVDFSDPLKKLLRAVEDVVEKYPAARLHPFLVVESDDLPDVAGVGAEPSELAKQLQAGGLDEKQRAELVKKLDDASKADDLRLELTDKLEKAYADLKFKHLGADPDALAQQVQATPPDDPKRPVLEKQLQDAILADEARLQIALVGKDDLKEFKLDDAGFVFYLFDRGKVTAARVLPKDAPLTDADVQAITALDLAPFGRENTAVVVTRDADLGDPLKDLLRRLDETAEKDPGAQLHPVLALMSDDPKRNDAAADLAKALMLKHVEVVAAGPSELTAKVRGVRPRSAAGTAAEPPDVADVGFAFVMARKGKVTGGLVLKNGEKLTPEVVNDVLKTLTELTKAGVP